MKVLFIEAKRKIGSNAINPEALSKLPEDINAIGIVYSIQYKDFADKVRKALSGKKAFVGGQVIGCNVSNAKRLLKKVNAFLFIGSGRFHAFSIAMLGKPVFVLNPESGIIERIDEKEINRIRLLKKAALIKFLNANKIGIIVSTKYGQYNMKEALLLKEKLEKKHKNPFIFLCDNINEAELENFDCEAWVNTACQAMLMEPKILNINDVKI